MWRIRGALERWCRAADRDPGAAGGDGVGVGCRLGRGRGAGEGVKERCDFLAFAAKQGATIEDLAWMENNYSPPIGALFEPISIAAQNCLADVRAAMHAPRATAPAPSRAVPA